MSYFTSVAGIVFKDRKLPISTWTDFLAQLFSRDGLESTTREDRCSVTAHPYWRQAVRSAFRHAGRCGPVRQLPD
ncbi:hypothetical protein HMPREF0762_01277 [Slackia exigua ATCC 700122]|uniref:Uncharacterized protein n=1 Tax=Slackia exigua (strain ATCC 700122 / DSM 15923 / CIP 105133 / JCM 11022 / KCTC 5966 / S-7) TaxID=649764 RepID=D0WH12_SLAES|nr:hypothetical protein HMPREF0762_01277 [Slackia exigua ATCC 700122]